ncbi:MAG: thioredoxin-like domain-containing protein [Flavobacteriaceae bacterium]
MKHLLFVLLLSIAITSCAQETKTNFDAIDLAEIFIDQKGSKIPFEEILAKYEGKTVFIDIWASWCSDCVKSIPELKELQAKEKEVVYVMLSLDKSKEKWQIGIEKHNLQAEHYLFVNKWKESKFCESIALDWIPRYIIVSKDGSIKMYKAIKIKDKKISKAIKEDK